MISLDLFRVSFMPKGMVFYEPADGERIWKEQVMKSVWPKFYSSIGGREQVDKALQVLGR